MAMAPVPTPEILWRKPPVLALAAVPGTALGHLGEPSTASSAAWAAAGAAVRTLHDAPPPPWPGWSLDELASRLDGECEWLVANDVLPADLVTRNRQLAETALRPWTPVFIHGDLQVDHVFVDGDEVTGVIDWSEASQGDALFDVAILTLGHKEHLGDVLAGYGTDVDRDLIRAWWSLRCLTNVRWLAEHGYGSPEEYARSAVLLVATAFRPWVVRRADQVDLRGAFAVDHRVVVTVVRPPRTSPRPAGQRAPLLRGAPSLPAGCCRGTGSRRPAR
ncbi:MAG: phosphotransferase family protein [Streptosporangiaceae bacterium]